MHFNLIIIMRKSILVIFLSLAVSANAQEQPSLEKTSPPKQSLRESVETFVPGTEPEIVCELFELKNISNKLASERLNRMIRSNRLLKDSGLRVMPYQGDNSIVYWCEIEIQPIVEALLEQMDRTAKPEEEPETEDQTVKEEAPPALARNVPEKTTESVEKPAIPDETYKAIQQILLEKLKIGIERCDALKAGFEAGVIKRTVLLQAEFDRLLLSEDLLYWELRGIDSPEKTDAIKAKIADVLEQQFQTVDTIVKYFSEQQRSGTLEDMEKLYEARLNRESVRIKQLTFKLESGE